MLNLISNFSALIYSQICGICITLVIFVLYVLQKKLPMKTGKYFLMVIITAFLVNVFDVVSVLLNTYHPDLMSTKLVAKMYLIMMCLSLICVVLYLANDVLERKKYNIVYYVCLLLFLLVCCIMGFTRIRVVDVYTAGIGVSSIYVIAGLLIAYNIIFAIINRKKMIGDKALIIIVWMSFWIIIAGIQFLFPKMLLVSFGLTLGVMIVYIKIENLDNQIDTNTGLFNVDSYMKYIKESKLHGNKCSMIYLKASKMGSLEDKTVQESLKLFNDVLRKRKDIIPFSNNADYLIILKKDNLEEIKNMLIELRNDEILIGSYYNAFYFSDASKLKNFNSIGEIANATLEVNPDSLDSFFIVDEKSVAKYDEFAASENIIRDAIENERVVVYFQPIYSTKKQIFTSAEALVRIIDENGKLVQPGAFIPVAEKNGMIHTLDEIVFKNVCKFIASNNMESLGLEYIEVNLSAVQLSDNKLADKYISIMKSYKIDPKYINLEVTESANIEHFKSSKRNIKKLTNYGISLSLDDFGTGYSNLTYVAQMPVEIIKFDKTMTNEFFKDGKMKYVVGHTIKMFKDMDLKIVAEGIETEEQLRAMENNDVDYIQGYFFSKPINEESFIKFIKEKNLPEAEVGLFSL